MGHWTKGGTRWKKFGWENGIGIDWSWWLCRICSCRRYYSYQLARSQSILNTIYYCTFEPFPFPTNINLLLLSQHKLMQPNINQSPAWNACFQRCAFCCRLVVASYSLLKSSVLPTNDDTIILYAAIPVRQTLKCLLEGIRMRMMTAVSSRWMFSSHETHIFSSDVMHMTAKKGLKTTNKTLSLYIIIPHLLSFHLFLHFWCLCKPGNCVTLKKDDEEGWEWQSQANQSLRHCIIPTLLHLVHITQLTL